MGSLLRKLSALFLAVFLSISVSLAHEDQETLEKYRTIASEFRDAYEAFLDMETFRPTNPPGHDVRELKEEDIRALATWRNQHGVPWTTWAYEKELTLESRTAHSARVWALVHLYPSDIIAEFQYFLLAKKGFEFSDEEKEKYAETLELPERFSDQELVFSEFELNRWFRENVSAVITDTGTAVFESYAWYTSPGYQKGSLPEELEAALEAVGKDELPEWVYELSTPFSLWSERALALLRSGNFEVGSGPYYAGITDLEFLLREGRFSELGYYKDLLKVVLSIEEDTDNFPNLRGEFERLIKEFPGSSESFIVMWGEGLIEDYEILQEYKDQPDNEIVNRWPGEQTLGQGRERVTNNLDGYKEFIEAFIQRWSELQSLDD